MVRGQRTRGTAPVDFAKRIRKYYLPVYRVLANIEQNSLLTGKYFQMLKEFPEGEIYYKVLNLVAFHEERRRYSEGYVRGNFYWEFPSKKQRPKNFQEYVEFIEKLYFSYMLYSIFRARTDASEDERSYYRDFGVAAFYLPAAIKTGVVDKRRFKTTDWLKIRGFPVLSEIDIDAYVPAKFFFNFVSVNETELRKIRNEWREFRAKLNLRKEDKLAFITVKVFEVLFTKLFIIIAKREMFK